MPKLMFVQRRTRALARFARGVGRRMAGVRRHARLAVAASCGIAAMFVMCSALASVPAGDPPHVGDRLPINVHARAAGARLADVPARLVAGPWAPPGRACVLDEAVMLKPGGTLTVLAVRPDGIMLSWVGGITARRDTCPSPGRLLVSEANYRELALIRVPGQPWDSR